MTPERDGRGANVALRSVTQGYGKKTVLSDVSLELGLGVTALVGPNGAGKTTLMRTVTTALPPRRGEVAIGGETVRGTRGARRARRRIGYLPQEFGADPRFTVREYVTYLAWVRQAAGIERSHAVERAIRDLGLEEQASTRMKALSGGMRQRAGIAGAIVGDPEIVVLDEPTVGLDPAQRLGFREVLRGQGDRCVLLSTHLVEDVAAVADRVVVVVDGKVLFDGTVAELATRGAEQAGVTQLESAYLAVVASPVA